MSAEVIFLALGIAILALALVVGRLFRRTANRQMPGSDRDTARGVWFGARDDGDGSH